MKLQGFWKDYRFRFILWEKDMFKTWNTFKMLNFNLNTNICLKLKYEKLSENHV